MGAPRRRPGEKHILESTALPRGRPAVHESAAERGKHQQVSLRSALRRQHGLHSCFKIGGCPLAQSIEIALQMRRRRQGGKIIVVDTRREEFVDGEGNPPGA
jgi:hypothetical protein